MDMKRWKELEKQAIHKAVEAELVSKCLVNEACSRVAEKMGRTPSSVHNIYFSLGGNTHSRHGNCTFSNEEEGLVAGMVMAFSAVNLPLSNKEAHDKAEVMLKRKIPKLTFNKLLVKHDEEICS